MSDQLGVVEVMVRRQTEALLAELDHRLRERAEQLGMTPDQMAAAFYIEWLPADLPPLDSGRCAAVRFRLRPRWREDR